MALYKVTGPRIGKRGLAGHLWVNGLRGGEDENCRHKMKGEGGVVGKEIKVLKGRKG